MFTKKENNCDCSTATKYFLSSTLAPNGATHARYHVAYCILDIFYIFWKTKKLKSQTGPYRCCKTRFKINIFYIFYHFLFFIFAYFWGVFILCIKWHMKSGGSCFFSHIACISKWEVDIWKEGPRILHIMHIVHIQHIKHIVHIVHMLHIMNIVHILHIQQILHIVHILYIDFLSQTRLHGVWRLGPGYSTIPKSRP